VPNGKNVNVIIYVIQAFLGVIMARITIEDCLKQIPNRFQLTLAATYRARLLLQGHTPKVDAKDKPTVIALPI